MIRCRPHPIIDPWSFWDILDEKDPFQNCGEELLAGKVQQVGRPELESTPAELAEHAFSRSYSSEATNSGNGASDFSAECVWNPYDHRNQKPSASAGSPARSDYHDESFHRSLNHIPSFSLAPQGRSLVIEKIPDLDFVDHFDSSEHKPDESETAETSSMNVGIPTARDPPGGYIPQFILNNVDMSNLTDEWEELSTQTTPVHSDEVFETQVAILGATTMGATLTEESDLSEVKVKCEDDICTSSSKQRPAKLDTGLKPMSQFLPHLTSIKKERVNNFFSKGMASFSSNFTRKKSPAGKSLGNLFPPVLSCKNFSGRAKNENEILSMVPKDARQIFSSIVESAHRKPNRGFGYHCTDVKALEQPYPQSFTSMCRKDEIMEDTTQPQSKDVHFLKVSSHTTHTTAIVNSFEVDDDPDLTILQGPSESRWSIDRKPLGSSQGLMISDPLTHVGMGGAKRKVNDERLVLRAALQDLSQPKTEASLPDGVLTVPLLRHQRIALSWMVQKETASLHCSGGILADDQGLGKTLSTIALIVKERPSNSSVCAENYKHIRRETYNLDEDDDYASVLGEHEQDAELRQEFDGSLMSGSPAAHPKGRPCAGTLIVCPTSVLRQWADELNDKLTSKAKLSVLVYHGSNRTKDPCELARYDVVLTTYSIVSMEVPKEPIVNKDDDESKRDDYHVVPKKKSKKFKKESNSLLLESSARPLARVGWFRVVLDEAQSIKNHRTQVAQACWGLRAKRRWCLSGTPIQNAVDDLYSYFRFLRYDPYATYKLFCSSIKVPISRNPTTGYKKLQAVLKTVMLRRTKGTLLDGKPIVNLPPKTVELKKVEFTTEERDFYCRLEADSRARFEEYAAAGTVKLNYINILLMLLRLRQACDHLLLVKGFNSSSGWSSSVEIAKKLPREKQLGLLSCLEASLAICGICNDSPEDAVVTSCGHVFCNQCICEHLTGEYNQCPTTNCKGLLSATSVFSRNALKCCLSEEPGQDITPDNSASDKLENSSWAPSFVSSKIKAALEVLESLSKPKPSTDDVNTLPKKSIDPFEMEEVSDTDIDDNEDMNLVEGSKQLVEVAGDKAIVFSQWTSMLDLLETGLKSSSIQYRRLDGTMSLLARHKAVNEFKTIPEVTVMIMSLKAASLGLNMVAACHVILLDLWWNPTTEDQAVDRAHRIGQTRPVSVLRLTVKDTIEDRILALQQKKREMVASAFGEDETGGNQTRLTVADLKYLFMA